MPRTLRPVDVFPITTRVLEVIRAADVTPGMRRVTLGGPGLAAHTAANGFAVDAFRSAGFDDEFKIILRHPDAAETVGPTQADGVLNWPREDPHLLMRTYTVRRWDAERGEIDVDFVVHGVGPATSWARRVQPGERVQIAGPKMSVGHPEGVDWTLVAGDETALPAIGRWLEQWPDGQRAQVFVEIAEPSHRQDLTVPPGVEITWLSRDGAEPGTTTLLFDAIRAADWPEGRVFAWVAGETLTLIPIRRWLRGEKGLGKEQVEVTGYWRRHEVVVSSDDASMPDLDATEDDAERLHELSELAPAFALRVAATIGLGAAFGGETRTVAEAAAATGTDVTGLGKLLRLLTAIGAAEAVDAEARDAGVQDAGAQDAGAAGAARHRLTGLGRLLDDDRVIAELDLAGPVAHRELGGMLSLLSAVRTGTGDYARWFGASYAAHERADRPRLQARLDREAERAEYVAGVLASTLTLPPGAALALTGQGAGVFADEIVRRHPGTRVTVVGSAGEVGDLPERVHGVGFAEALGSLTDADAADALRRAAARVVPGGRLLVFTRALDPGLADDHDYADDLVEFALHGGGVRTHDENLRLFAAAGLPEPARRTVGWGFSAYAVTVTP